MEALALFAAAFSFGYFLGLLDGIREGKQGCLDKELAAMLAKIDAHKNCN